MLPRYVRTPSPLKKASHLAASPANQNPASDPYYVDSCVSEGEEDELDYERERHWWEAWQRDGLLRLQAKVKALEKERESLEELKFPTYEQWHSNRELLKAAERGLKKYSNGDTFQHVNNQLIGRELSNAMPRTLEVALSIATQHPATRITRVSPGKRKEPYL
jgi:hypothetical protein